MPEIFPNNPGIPAVLSFIFSGLGQIYNGQIKKGLVIIFFSAIGMLLILGGAVLIGYWLVLKNMPLLFLICGAALFVAGLILICYLGVYSILDAYRVARKP